MNIVDCLKGMTEKGFLEWIFCKEKNGFQVLMGKFILTVFEKKIKTEIHWVLEINKVNGGLDELVGYHGENNGYPNVCALFIAAKESASSDASILQKN